MPVQGRSICGPVDQIASLSNATSLPAPSDSDRHVGSCRMGVSKKKPREKGRTRIPLGRGVKCQFCRVCRRPSPKGARQTSLCCREPGLANVERDVMSVTPEKTLQTD